MRRDTATDALPEVADDDGWLDVDRPTDEKPDAPSAFFYVLEEIESFERFFAGQVKTEEQWSYFWRQKWWPKAKPEQRYPKSAPKIIHPHWRRGTPQFERAMQVATPSEKRIWQMVGFAQIRASDDRLTFIDGEQD